MVTRGGEPVKQGRKRNSDFSKKTAVFSLERLDLILQKEYNKIWSVMGIFPRESSVGVNDTVPVHS